jgi:polar amino acid transport system permease protein
MKQERVLPVLLPGAAQLAQAALRERRDGWRLRLQAAHGVALLAAFVTGCAVAQAQAHAGNPSILEPIWKWTPLLARGFVFNLAISFLAMGIGTLAGLLLGYAQISLLPPVKKGAWFATHFFRNAPWLVLLFYCMFLLPFEVTIFGIRIPIPDWTKATLGLALPVMANVSEIVRGAIQSIPTTQWEAAASLAFNRRQTMWMIIFPQCIKRMLPPYGSTMVMLLKDSSLASTITVTELSLQGKLLASSTFENTTIFTLVALIYLAMSLPLTGFNSWLERRMGQPR